MAVRTIRTARSGTWSGRVVFVEFLFPHFAFAAKEVRLRGGRLLMVEPLLFLGVSVSRGTNPQLSAFFSAVPSPGLAPAVARSTGLFQKSR